MHSGQDGESGLKRPQSTDSEQEARIKKTGGTSEPKSEGAIKPAGDMEGTCLLRTTFNLALTTTSREIG